ncbi:hypothetical protein HDU99_000215, partial [Rhizoclosmatium hyalinum]
SIPKSKAKRLGASKKRDQVVQKLDEVCSGSKKEISVGNGTLMNRFARVTDDKPDPTETQTTTPIANNNFPVSGPEPMSDEEFKILMHRASTGDMDDELGFAAFRSIVRLQLKVIHGNFEFLMDQLVTGGFDEELGMSPSLWDELWLAQE